MKNLYLPDTSTVLRFYEIENPVSVTVGKCFAKLISSGAEIVIVPQVLVEFWTVATRPKAVNGLGLTTEEAAQALENLQTAFRLLPENAQIFDEWKLLVAKHKVSGKPSHDARIVAAMLSHKIENILTLNAGDFKRYTEIAAMTPQQVLQAAN